jgi:hypothetical protein
MDMSPRENPQALKQARPGLHDPTAEMAGAPPALSPLSLRWKLAAFGLLCGVVGAIFFSTVVTAPPIAIVFAVVALTAIVDIAVIARRKQRGEPG